MSQRSAPDTLGPTGRRPAYLALERTTAKLSKLITLALGAGATALWLSYVAGDYSPLLVVPLSVAAIVRSVLERRSRRIRTLEHPETEPKATTPLWASRTGYVILVAAIVLGLFNLAADPQTELWPALAERDIHPTYAAAAILSAVVLVLAAIGWTDLGRSQRQHAAPLLDGHAADLD